MRSYNCTTALYVSIVSLCDCMRIAQITFHIAIPLYATGIFSLTRVSFQKLFIMNLHPCASVLTNHVLVCDVRVLVYQYPHTLVQQNFKIPLPLRQTKSEPVLQHPLLSSLQTHQELFVQHRRVSISVLSRRGPLQI